jgi:hypothetical protein
MRIVATTIIGAVLALLGTGGHAQPDTRAGCLAEMRRAAAGHPRAADNPCDGLTSAEYAAIMRDVGIGGHRV